LLSAYIPTLLLEGGLPNQALPVWSIVKSNARIFVTILPIIGIQYLISLRFKNFLVPVGIGLLALVGTLIAAGLWEYTWISPYAYCIFNVITGAQANVPINFYWMSVLYFVVLTGINYYLYSTRSEKG
jgi:hypothetical protein